MSPETIATLTMLRRSYRAFAPAPTKRPIGGRPNPCAQHRDPSHPLAEMARLGASRPHRRHQQLRRSANAAWRMFSEAVQRGDIPVGTPITEKDIRSATGFGATYGMEMLALQLSTHREPVRIRQVGLQKWVAALV